MKKITDAIKLWEDLIITEDECIEKILSSINASNVEKAMLIIHWVWGRTKQIDMNSIGYLINRGIFAP